ncbi:unnamed protein product, partial [Vitis vinifera]|uniref:Uncharacterized protein n=1 Tax=Vitis vinifera TaxID=29760 RepID=D7TLW9_VITVI
MGKPKGFFRSVGDMGAAKGRVLVSNSKVGLEGGRGGDRSEKISAKDCK